MSGTDGKLGPEDVMELAERPSRTATDGLTDEQQAFLDQLQGAGTSSGGPRELGIQKRRVSCGRDNCRCAGARAEGREEDLHGPYAYQAYRTDDGRLRWTYIGPVPADD